MNKKIQKQKETGTGTAYPTGIKWTKQRKSVYDILVHAEEPLSVQDIYSRIIQKESGYAVSTIYRILSAFEEKGMVMRSAWLGEDTALFEWNKGEHTHYATCLGCHKRIALPYCPLEQTIIAACDGDFTVTDHKLELYGYCKDCVPMHACK